MSQTIDMSEFNEGKPVSVRMTSDLEERISKIAKSVHRSRNTTIILLLERGIEAFRQDGVLVDTRPTNEAANLYQIPVVEQAPPKPQGEAAKEKPLRKATKGAKR